MISLKQMKQSFILKMSTLLAYVNKISWKSVNVFVHTSMFIIKLNIVLGHPLGKSNVKVSVSV